MWRRGCQMCIFGKILGSITCTAFGFQHLHVDSVVKKATSKLHFLYRSGASLDERYRRLLCSALISSGIEYCISAWYPGLFEESKKALATLQRKMVRFVESMHPRQHVADVEILSLGWLPLPWRVDYFLLMHVMKAKLSLSPAYIASNFTCLSEVHSYGLRQSEVNFSLSCCSFPFGSFTRTATTLWNKLPVEM